MKVLRNILGYILSTLYWWTRPLVKWILRRTTRLCELQRICYGECKGAQRTLQVEFSLDNTRSEVLQKLTHHLDSEAKEQSLKDETIQYAVYAIVHIKTVNTKYHGSFSSMMSECLTQIWGYRQLISCIERLRVQSFDRGNLEHEAMLMKLWNYLMPDVPLEARMTRQWQEVGFQGDDPATDFRGMGMLSLQNLLFFAETHTSAARHVLLRSQHPSYGYSYAIVGINITHMAYTLVICGAAKPHFYNVSKTFPDLHAFHQFFCYLFFEFDVLWQREKPKDIMEFNRVRDKFDFQIRKKLKGNNAYLKCNFVLENI